MKAAEIKKLIDGPAFFAAIEKFVSEAQCPYVDAILHHCEVHDIDPDLAAALIKSNSTFKKKLSADAATLYMVK